MAAASGSSDVPGRRAPWESSPEIIATGVYDVTRNPMYVGLGLLQAGSRFPRLQCGSRTARRRSRLSPSPVPR